MTSVKIIKDKIIFSMCSLHIKSYHIHKSSVIYWLRVCIRINNFFLLELLPFLMFWLAWPGWLNQLKVMDIPQFPFLNGNLSYKTTHFIFEEWWERPYYSCDLTFAKEVGFYHTKSGTESKCLKIRQFSNPNFWEMLVLLVACACTLHRAEGGRIIVRYFCSNKLHTYDDEWMSI